MFNSSRYGCPDGKIVTEIYERLRHIYPSNIDEERIDPLSFLIFAILSQRTSHENAQVAFDNLGGEFPNWYAIRDANVKKLERLIETSTWPEQKAPRIREALEYIACLRSGILDLNNLHTMSDIDACAWLERMTGVGRKSSTAVLMFSTMRRAVLPVDTSHKRMAIRIGLLREKISSIAMHNTMQSIMPLGWGYREVETYHNIVKQHGRRFCTLKEPNCKQCPLLDLCQYGSASQFGMLVTAPKNTKSRACNFQEHPWQLRMDYEEEALESILISRSGRSGRERIIQPVHSTR